MLTSQSHEDLILQDQVGRLIRAISQNSELHIRDWNVFKAEIPQVSLAPHLQWDPNTSNIISYRGSIDGMALRYLYSDIELHSQLTPKDLIGSFIFEVLEQIRVESRCPTSLKGTQENIQQQFQKWLESFMSNGLLEGSIALLLFSVFGQVWSYLNAQELPQLMQDTMEATRAGLYQTLGKYLKSFKELAHDQYAYSLESKKLIKSLSGIIEQEYQAVPSLRTKQKVFETNKSHQIEWVPPEETKTSASTISGTNIASSRTELNSNTKKTYHIYSSIYDKEFIATKSIRAAQLKDFRLDIDQHIKSMNVPFSKLIQAYKTAFNQPLDQSWQRHVQDGYLDYRYLQQIVISKGQKALYKQISLKKTSPTHFTFLIDCSGSMKSQRLKTASWVDVIVRVLELAGISSEVLGYSTNAWMGGRPYKDWQRAGRPSEPGRLNERAHWIFKDKNTSWRKSKLGIAALLKEDIYKESLDGEALLWAYQRSQDLASKIKDRKIILLSDGCPMDSMTMQHNLDVNYLATHLITTLSHVSKQPLYQVWGCGVGKEGRSSFTNRLSWDINDVSPEKNLLNWLIEFHHS